MDLGDNVGASYYNDLLSRVDSTLTEGRAAYGGYEEEPARSEGGLEMEVYVLWGRDEALDRESRLAVVAVYLLSTGALAFSLATSDVYWLVQWLLATALAHLAAVAVRFGLTRLDLAGDVRKAGMGFVGLVFIVWIIAAMATCTRAQIGFGFLMWFTTFTLGAVLVEAAARVAVQALAQAHPPEPDADEIQYAAL